MTGGPAIWKERCLEWWEERTGFSAVSRLASKKEVPLHRHTVWYYLGGMSLFLFGIQVATGILLLLYYRPSSDHAFESVQFLMTKVAFGWLIRSIHSWSANLLIFVLLAHMFSVFFMKAYRKPRELTWITGVLLLGLMLFFGFSGYLLPWNKLAFFATQVGTEVAGSLPLIGDFTLRFLRGGPQVTGGTLTRFFGFHVAVLPALTTVVLGLHLLLVQKHGMSLPPSVRADEKQPPRMKFFPNFLLRDAVGWCVALGLLAALAAIFPWELGEKADPFAPAPAGIRPEWYFGWMFQSLKMVPGHVLFVEGEVFAVVLFALGGLVWFLVPFLDRNDEPGNRVSRAFTVFGCVLVTYMAVMTVWMYVAAKGAGT